MASAFNPSVHHPALSKVKVCRLGLSWFQLLWRLLEKLLETIIKASTAFTTASIPIRRYTTPLYTVIGTYILNMSFLYPRRASQAGEVSLNQNSTPDFQIFEGKTRGQVNEQRSAMVLRLTRLIHFTRGKRLGLEGNRILAFFPSFWYNFEPIPRNGSRFKVALPRGILILDIVSDKCRKVQVILQLSSAIVASPLACLLHVYFSRYPPNGELARRLTWRSRKSFVNFSMRSYKRSGWLGSLDLGFSNRDLRKFFLQNPWEFSKLLP